MSESGGETPWYMVLHSLLEAPSVGDEEIVEFIEEEVPQESDVLDYKGDLYISARSSHHQKRRESRLIKLFSALANVRTGSIYRYVFIGFDDNGNFEGLKYRDPRDGEQLLDVDDSRVRNIFDGKISPTPDFELFDLAHDGKRGGVVVIRQAEQVPLVVEKTLRKSGGGEFIAAGQAFTRDGSSTKRMGNSDFRDLMQYRERIINQKIRDLSDEFAQVVGIPDEQLAELELKVTPGDDEDAMPVRELVTPDPTETPDETLNSAVKTWRSTGSLEISRDVLYWFFLERQKLKLDAEDEDEDDKKTEFLIRASLRNHFHGAYWITEYNHDIDDLLETIIDEDINGTTIRPLERVLLVMGKGSYLRKINQMDLGLESSKAGEFAKIANDAKHERVLKYTTNNIKVGSTSYPVYKLVYGHAQVEPLELMDELASNLRDKDNHRDRGRLRNLELVYLARNG